MDEVPPRSLVRVETGAPNKARTPQASPHGGSLRASDAEGMNVPNWLALALFLGYQGAVLWILFRGTQNAIPPRPTRCKKAGFW